MRRIDIVLLPAAAAAGLVLGAPSWAQTRASLTLSDAISRAARADPGLEAASADVEAAEGGRRQAEARPNPQLGMDVENFSGSGDLRGFQSAETTFTLSQEVELGGKRRARIALADRELSIAQIDRIIRRLDLFRDVAAAYYEALAAQQMAEIARDRLETAQAMERAVARRVNAARDPLMAGARANATLAEAEAAASRAEQEAVTKRTLLASFWRGVGDFALPDEAFAVDDAQRDAPSTASEAPDIARLTAARDRAIAAQRSEQAQSYQNPTLSAGFRRFGETDTGAFVAGVSMPIGIFDRNGGAIARARAQARGAQFELEAGEQQFERDRARLTGVIAGDRQTAAMFALRIIPQAERALDLARSGYDRGAFSYLDVIEAERALADAREARVSALLSLHTNQAGLDRLTGRLPDPLPIEGETR